MKKLVRHLSQKKTLEILPLLIERDGGHFCFYCKSPLSIEKQVYEHLNSNRYDNRSENIVLACQSCNVKKENDLRSPFVFPEFININDPSVVA